MRERQRIGDQLQGVEHFGGDHVDEECRIRPCHAPPTGALYQVSPEEGRAPVWSRDGEELFYHHQSSNRLMVVKVTTSPALAFSAPTALPIEDTIHPLRQRNFDATPDGRHLLVVLPGSADGDARSRIQVVQHWTEELKRLAPAR